ncbi:MAG: amidohydrolase [Zavarzinella sp.]
MSKNSFFPFLLFVSPLSADHNELIKSVDSREKSTWEIAQKIWEFAEPGYQEIQSTKLLAKELENAGFEIKFGVAEIPTAFTATIGSGKPVIGILGEYDALPELAQEAVPERKIRKGNGYGHACGHHLFGAASMSAAIALGEQIRLKKINGTIRFYGCPAEEGGSAKAFMVRAGLFEDCDVVLHWHPSSKNSAGDNTCLSRIAVKFRFHGKAAHAAGSPEAGRSALDGVALTTHAAELLREHCPDFTRIHHTITHGGGNAPNVVPEFAEVFFYVRHPDSQVIQKIYPRLLKCAQGAALATETRLEIVELGGTKELLPNRTLSDVIAGNLKKLNQIRYSEDDFRFATRMQQHLDTKVTLDSIKSVEFSAGKLTKGSTDVGDVSWVVPTAGFTTACYVPGTPAHSWQAVAAGGTTIGKQGMQLAAKTMACSAWDLLMQPEVIAAAKKELSVQLGERKYEPLIGKNQKPPLDYRNPPRQ